MLTRAILAGATLVLAFSGAARADGCYIPEKAIQKLPEIPAQRALLAFRDGKETLIVESALEGQGRRFGWIIPVPGRPDSIEAATPGTLKSLAMGIQPKIVHDLHDSGFLLISFCVFVLGLSLFILRRKALSCGEWAAAPVILLVVAGLFLPAVGRIRSQTFGLPGALVLEQGRVGSYEISVLAAEDSEALSTWLGSEGLAVPQVLRATVDDYARRGWKFVTAKLTTDGAGQVLPHPLRITFRSKEAVYPMRLTGLSGRELNLELYVVGDQAAEVRGMKRMFCDQFLQRNDGDREETVGRVTVRTGTRYAGESSNLAIGHPGVAPLLWEGCCITKLSGRISPAAMGEDLMVAWNEPRFERQSLYSHHGAGAVALNAAAICFTALALLALIAGRIWKWTSLRHAAVIGCGLALAVALFFALRLGLPQTEVATVRPIHSIMKIETRELATQLDKLPEGPKDASAARRAIQEFAKSRRNMVTGEPVREEDSPGNYTVSEKDGKLAVTLYDLGGTPVTVELEAAGGKAGQERK